MGRAEVLRVYGRCVSTGYSSGMAGRAEPGESGGVSRPHVRLRAGRPVLQYAGDEGCAGLAGAEAHA